METSPFKPARANQGLARPPVQTRDSAGPPARAWETPARGGRVNLLPRLLWSNTDASGYTLTLQAQSGAAMEHSLHRVSLCSRRAHPGLSFYLTTFGKCPLRPAARAAAPRSQRPESIDEVGSRQAFCLGEPSLAPSSCGCPGGAQGTGSGHASCRAPPAPWPLVPSAVGSASLGWHNHAPVNLSETRFVTTEFPISKQLGSIKVLFRCFNISVLFPLVQGQGRCQVSPSGLDSLWAHLGSSVTAPVDI